MTEVAGAPAGVQGDRADQAAHRHGKSGLKKWFRLRFNFALRWSRIRRLLSQIIVATLGMCGLLVTAYKAVEIFFPQQSPVRADVKWFLETRCGWLLLAFAVIAVARHWPRRHIRRKISGNIEIEVRVADLFALGEPADLVVGTNTSFATEVAPSPENGPARPEQIIKRASVQGQLTTRYFPGKGAATLKKQVEDSLHQQEARLCSERYPIGQVAAVQLPGTQNHAYMLAIADVQRGGGFVTALPMVEQALTSLWRYLQTRGGNNPVAIHLLGTGVLRLNVNRQFLIMEIVDSLFIASYRAKQVPAHRLIIVVHEKDFLEHDIDFYEIERHLDMLSRLHA